MSNTVKRPPASKHARSDGSSKSSRRPRGEMHPEQEQLLDDLWKKHKKLYKHREKESFCLYPAAFQEKVVDKCEERVKKHGNLYEQFVERNEKELRDQAELEALRQLVAGQQAPQQAAQPAGGT